ncbi:Uncharacterised protein [Klebsiella pneumoniae]|nr:Uncharacterised protein [Klebsiella pneumoniae]
MPARPAASGVLGRRPRAEQRTVGFLAAELRQAPGALHGGERLERSDYAGCKAHGEEHIGQRPAQCAPWPVEQSGDGNQQAEDADGDHQLLDPVVQDVLQEPAVPADEAGARVVHQVGQGEVEGHRLEGQQQCRQAQRQGEEQPGVEWTGRGMDGGLGHAISNAGVDVLLTSTLVKSTAGVRAHPQSRYDRRPWKTPCSLWWRA